LLAQTVLDSTIFSSHLMAMLSCIPCRISTNVLIRFITWPWTCAYMLPCAASAILLAFFPSKWTLSPGQDLSGFWSTAQSTNIWEYHISVRIPFECHFHDYTITQDETRPISQCSNKVIERSCIGRLDVFLSLDRTTPYEANLYWASEPVAPTFLSKLIFREYLNAHVLPSCGIVDGIVLHNLNRLLCCNNTIHTWRSWRHAKWARRLIGLKLLA